MKRGPKPTYCYVCQKMGPCVGDDPCNRLAREDKAIAYRNGYYAVHAERLRAAGGERYRSCQNFNDLKARKEVIKEAVTEHIQSKEEYKEKQKENAVEIKPGPKVKFCYICQNYRPCPDDSACHTLPKVERSRAYQIGYFTKKNGHPPGQIRVKSLPDPEAERERIKQRDLEAENKRREAKGIALRVRRDKSITPEEREKAKRERWKFTKRARTAARTGREHADKEADRRNSAKSDLLPWEFALYSATKKNKNSAA